VDFCSNMLIVCRRVFQILETIVRDMEPDIVIFNSGFWGQMPGA
jgi:hypothetical protein